MGEETILVKVHKSYRNVIALCDKDIKGTVLKEEPKKLDLSGPFFEGEEMTEKQVLETIEEGINEDATFNIVGKLSVAIAKKAGIINNEGIMMINDVPYALVLV